MVHAKKYEIR